jgi:ubiquinone/menaquinone biosynthesis C-methylase UbiE
MIDAVRLNLGSGDTRIPGFINVDLYNPAADLKADVSSLPYANETVEEIVAYHVIEHINPAHLQGTLNEWYRILKPGGKLAIEMPDILELCRHFIDAPMDGDFGKWRILNCIYGTTQIAHPHLFGWFFEMICPLFATSGFKNIIKTPTTLNHWCYNFRLECSKGA